MRQIEKQVIGAYIRVDKASNTNTKTDGQSLWLYGHKIAQRVNGRHAICFQGWPTQTTQSRINSLCELLNLGRPFRIKKGTLLLHGVERSHLDWIFVDKINRQ